MSPRLFSPSANERKCSKISICSSLHIFWQRSFSHIFFSNSSLRFPMSLSFFRRNLKSFTICCRFSASGRFSLFSPLVDDPSTSPMRRHHYQKVSQYFLVPPIVPLIPIVFYS